MKLSYEQEHRLVAGILGAANFPGKDAAIISRVITHSDLTGVPSHGLSRLPRYLRQVQQGALNPRPRFEILRDDQAVLVVDGDNGSGILSVNRAYELALAKARQFGLGLATGRRNANIGCGSYYAWQAVEDDMICLLCCNTYAFAAPYGGAERLLGTNPLIVGIPTGDAHPLVLDISTTKVAMGKIQAAQRERQSIPPDWASDYEGRPTTDPALAYALSPIAQHKGYGLAVIAEALSTLLSGAAFGTDVGLFSRLEPENTGFFLLLIDPSRFLPLEEFKRSADRYVAMLKGSRKAPEVDEIFLPGELERRRYEELMVSGISVSPALEEELCQLARQLGLDFAGEGLSALLCRLEKDAASLCSQDNS